MEKKNAKKDKQKKESAEYVDASAESDAPLSKKEKKMLEKKREKEAKKAAVKAEKKAKKKGGDVEAVKDDAEIPAVPTAGVEEPEEKKQLTLEEKIRKERPPPRVRIMEGAQPGFVSLALENVGVTFKNQEVIKGASWGVTTGDRIGLVGPNGGGKTTQLRILGGDLEPTVGDVVKSSSELRVAMLKQEFVDALVPTRSLVDEFMSVFEEENQILENLKTCEEDLADIDASDTDKMQATLDRMEDLQAKADAKGVYQIRARAEKAMDLMGFTTEEREQPVSSFSGGWKMRIGLGKVLCLDPNVLLLDEPTNHLDLDSVEWLEAFLREQNIPMVIVSHDREFLDQVCNKIVDTEGGLATKYDGNYSTFLKQKKGELNFLFLLHLLSLRLHLFPLQQS
uniref:ABC transporter domain-containing protein n=1 Tax=Corethron hystrix TaxID=216773 RepID=A0A7S1FXD9_9STRA